jgi:hypothetical protein
MAHPGVANGEDGYQIWGVAMNILNKQSQMGDKGWFSSLCIRSGANSSSLLKTASYEMLNRIPDLDGFFGTA